MPNVVNKFLDSTLHKVLPGLVSAQRMPLPQACQTHVQRAACLPSSIGVLRPGLAGDFISAADPDWLIVAEEDSEAVAGSAGDSAVVI